jgi:hypothetical protein
VRCGQFVVYHGVGVVGQKGVFALGDVVERSFQYFSCNFSWFLQDAGELFDGIGNIKPYTHLLYTSGSLLLTDR